MLVICVGLLPGCSEAKLEPQDDADEVLPRFGIYIASSIVERGEDPEAKLIAGEEIGVDLGQCQRAQLLREITSEGRDYLHALQQHQTHHVDSKAVAAQGGGQEAIQRYAPPRLPAELDGLGVPQDATGFGGAGS